MGPVMRLGSCNIRFVETRVAEEAAKLRLCVKALQGLGMLDVSVVLWVQGSVTQWFDGSDEGVSPS